jgi:dienelactone hydrolase
VREQLRWPRLPWIPIASGALWLWQCAEGGLFAKLIGFPLGSIVLASGVALLLWPGDRRIPQTLALVSLIGALLLLPLVGSLGFLSGLVLLAASAASYLASGLIAIAQEPFTSGVPRPELTLPLAAQVGIDEFILGMEQLSIGLPKETERLVREVHEARELFESRGWLDDPQRYHEQPPELERFELRRADSRGIAYEHLEFESGYAPHAGEPGRERWLDFVATRTAHAYLLRQPDGAQRPWIVCNNGYRMGHAFGDLRLFRRFHQLGLNVLIPVLPLHGPRRVGRQSGDRFLAGEVLDTVHAEAQAMWDIRRMIAWLRREGATQIGSYGLSLGGYTTALLSALVDDLDCAIAGIPVSDFSRIFWRHGPKLQLDYLGHMGTAQEDAARVFRVVSPLALKPRVVYEGRMIFGAIADRLVTPDHVRDLWEHWDRPRIVWYEGGHCTFGLHPSVQEGVVATLRERKLLGDPV